MYTVMIADDGMFSAEYVVPPALSIPLGTSGSAVDVVRNEDGTFSADGEVITAETRVTAANGNVYAAVLSPEGVPVSAMHVAAMQDVMLGELGGTVKLTQAEDMSWWLGETAVADGSVHTHENGNMYTLMMDAEGMWSAMYKKVEVIVQLGTQHPITLERDEDMSWRLGSEAVDVGSEVMSDSGNTYTLWYADGVWSAQFEPESMMIEGTGLVAMTKEDRSGYDVDGADLPATGTSDIATSMGTYRVTMMDGDLMGVRLDPVAIDGDTDFKTVGLSGLPTILGDEDDTEDVNEGMTALVVGGEKHPFSALLGSGMSEKQGDNYVAKAREELVEIRARIESVLDVFETTEDKQNQVKWLWGTGTSADNRRTTVRETLESVFGDIGGLTVDSDDEPDFKDALSEIDDLIMALSSVDSLAAALGDDGVLDELEVDDKDKTAEFIFDATKSESSVSYGMTGMTRYGAIYKQTRANAVSNPDYDYDTDKTNPNEAGDGDELGAFAFGVTSETVRAQRVASAGNAFYEGGTLAVDSDGTHYSGDISIRVKFATEQVDGLITNLQSADGEPWQHLFADVSSIALPTLELDRDATFDKKLASSGSATMATISYALRAGSRGTQQDANSSWSGRLLTAEEEGDHAVGQWSVGGGPGSYSYLAGGFGAERVADEPDNRPALDDGTEVKAKLLTTFGDTENPMYAVGTSDDGTPGHGINTDGDIANGKTALGGGNLTVTVAKFGWTQETPATADTAADLNDGHNWERLNDPANDNDNDATREFKIDLANLVDKAGAGVFTMATGPTHVSEAKRLIEAERNKLEVLIETEQLPEQQEAIWQNVQEILLTRVFNADYAGVTPDADNDDPNALFGSRLPEKVYRAKFESDKALGWIDDILWALDSKDNLESALDKDENGLFVQYPSNTDGSEVVFGRDTAANLFGQREIQVRGTFGMTDFTRFGAWRVRRYRNALRSTGGNTAENGGGNQWVHGELDTFAYSPLDATTIRSANAANFPAGGEATYEGSTVAYVGRFDQNAGLVAFEGDVAVNVSWRSGFEISDGQRDEYKSYIGEMTAVISNFENASNGDRLLYSRSGTFEEVRELIFSGIRIFTTDENDAVVFNGTGLSSGGNVPVSVGYADRSESNTTLSGQQADTVMIDGAFVGNSSDGPLGVLGRYSIGSLGADAFSYEHAPGNPTGTDAAQAIRDAYEDVLIHGAFGADLP